MTAPFAPAGTTRDVALGLSHSSLAVDVESRLRAAGAKQSGDELRSNCPFCGDQGGHLYYNIQKHTWYCHKCLRGKAEGLQVLALALGIKCPEHRNGHQKAEIVTVYNYYGAEGQLLARKVRARLPNGDKTFWWERPDNKGNWLRGLGGIDPGLFRWREFQAAPADEWIFINEGEKATELCIAKGLKATNGPMGAGTWRDGWSLLLRGRRVAIIPDNDPKGEQHAQTVAREITPYAAEVKLLRLDGLTEKDDAFDWLHLGHEGKDLLALADSTPVWEPQPKQPMQSYIGLHTLHTSSLADLLADDEAEELPVLVERLLTSGGAALLAGKPGEGKTWLTLLIALMVAAGQKLLDRFNCTAGPVLIIDEENGLRRLRKRLRRLCTALGLDPSTIAPVEIASMNGIDLGNDEWAAAVRAKMESLRPVLVIVDSLVRVHKGDENSSRDVATLFSVVTELRTKFGAAFLFTHHLRKKGLVNDLSERVRGSSDIEAYVDSLLGLEKVDNRLILRQIKSRDDEPFKPLALEIADTDEGGTIIRAIGEIDEEVEKRETARALIKELVADGPKLRELLIEAGRETGLSERTMGDALKDLVSTKEIARGKDGRKTTYAPACVAPFADVAYVAQVAASPNGRVASPDLLGGEL